MQNPTTADLIFSEQANHNFSKTLGELKRSTLSIHNRLRSIQEDAKFATRVAAAYGRTLIANERCGSWYINPLKKGGSAYFKSTDGHTGVWKFSLRRLNLHLLGIIGAHDGCIIIDSTRRGKRMPDALSKTIPVWCSVVNRLLFPDRLQAHELYTPPQVVSKTEHAQIVALLPSFLEALQALHIPLDDLRSQVSKPLRPMWITPESQVGESDSVFDDYHPVICCTVSRRVFGGEASEGGYIQGAGDDTENWAHELTPTLFWENQSLLQSTPESDLPDLIKALVERGTSSIARDARVVSPTSCMLIDTLSSCHRDDKLPTIALLPKVTVESTWTTSKTKLELGLGPHKLGSRNLRTALPRIVAFAESMLLSADARFRPQQLVLCCESGKDLSIGAALAILCLLFEDDGSLRITAVRPSIDKNFIRRRLGWISTSMPDANPSRATLQSVNSFLMERP
ncbi:tRNA a64-2'-o-ribosylphosphate transferas-like protein [Calycina marina]|uniref:tRNA a64-2'-o-ribosylphosphate transferas-like protein n=1 Tax=Calycina marina TaxID=1763456 RepID=A0A9P7ZAP0_9HELO|nr:tRNA a64-2'-o-ribosylphosphate transferas-like protein [Calycina marina]